MTTHFYLERKELKSTEKAIYCYIRGFQKNKAIILNTGQKINPLFWDKEKERAIERGNKKYIGAKELNAFLNSYDEEIKRTIRSFLSDSLTADHEQIRIAVLERFGKSKKNQLSFFDALDEFIKVRTKDLSYDSIRKFTTIKNHLINYEKKERSELSFSQINLIFYDKFLSYLIEDKNMVNNSAFKIIGLLKIFLNWAYERGINKYQDFKKFRIKEDKVDIITLTNDEIEKIKKLDFSENPRLGKARDLFLFGCYTGGRFADLNKIDWADIRNDTWSLRPGKTRDILEIPLLYDSLAILEKYKHSEYPLPRLSNQKLNVYIKEVCELAEINDMIKTTHYRGSVAVVREEPKFNFISAHTARRTFITNSLLNGVKAEVVMSISGHSNYRTFKKYLNITRKDKEVELKKAWNKSELRLVKSS